MVKNPIEAKGVSHSEPAKNATPAQAAQVATPAAPAPELPPLLCSLVLLPKEKIKDDQDSIRTDLLSIDQRLHANAVQCLLHCEKHRDTSLMVRLLMDIVDDKTGYRRQAIIAWMRAFSPMELSGKTINLSGVNAKGNERPFNCEKAARTPFSAVSREVAIVKPAYRDTLMSPINTAMKNFRAAWDNTKDGKPIDPSKPFFDGVHGDKVVDFFDSIEKLQNLLPKDNTREIKQAQDALKKAIGDDKAAADKVAAEFCPTPEKAAG